jgi:hypothetical protein
VSSPELSRLAEVSYACAGNTLGMTETCDEATFTYSTPRNAASLISVYVPDRAASESNVHAEEPYERDLLLSQDVSLLFDYNVFIPCDARV